MTAMLMVRFSQRFLQDKSELHDAAEQPGTSPFDSWALRHQFILQRVAVLLSKAVLTWDGAHGQGGNKGCCMAGQHDGLVIRLVDSTDQLGQHLAA
jgi:hypothetical protein